MGCGCGRKKKKDINKISKKTPRKIPSKPRKKQRS